MNYTLPDRRQPALLGPQGIPLLPFRILHDRRRRQVVEELLDAMRLHGMGVRGAPSGGLKNRTVVHPKFWIALGVLVMVIALVALIARWADYSPDVSNPVLGAGPAIYRWIEFHRVDPLLP